MGQDLGSTPSFLCPVTLIATDANLVFRPCFRPPVDLPARGSKNTMKGHRSGGRDPGRGPVELGSFGS